MEEIIRKYWDKESATREAEKHSTRTAFKKASKGAYLFILRNKMLDELFPRKTSVMKKFLKLYSVFEFPCPVAIIDPECGPLFGKRGILLGFIIREGQTLAVVEIDWGADYTKCTHEVSTESLKVTK